MLDALAKATGESVAGDIVGAVQAILPNTKEGTIYTAINRAVKQGAIAAREDPARPGNKLYSLPAANGSTGGAVTLNS